VGLQLEAAKSILKSCAKKKVQELQKELAVRQLGMSNGVARNRWGEEAAGDQRAWLRGRLRRGCKGVGGIGWGENVPGCADGCGCKGVGGNGRGEEAAGDERAWVRGRLRTAWSGNGWGEEATAWG